MGIFSAIAMRLALLLPSILGGSWAILGGAVRFFATPVGQIVAVGLITVGAFVWGDLHRARTDAAWYRAEVARTQQHQIERDAAAKAEAQRDVAARVVTLEKLSAELQQRVNEYEKTLATSNACKLSPDDINRLRKL